MTAAVRTRIHLRPLTDEEQALAVVVQDEAIGFIKCRPGEPAEGWLTIADIELAEGRRGWGYGSEAVRLLEAMHPGSYLAKIDPRNGLSLYFWLRLGYHPAHADEAFWRAPNEHDTIAMIRTTENQEPRA